MQIIFNPIKGYTLEPDWVSKITQKIEKDTQFIEIYLLEFYIEEIIISVQIEKNGSCEVFYNIKLDQNKTDFSTIEFHFNFKKLRNTLLLNWDILNYIIGEDFSINSKTNYVEIRTQILNLDLIQLNNVFGMTF